MRDPDVSHRPDWPWPKPFAHTGSGQLGSKTKRNVKVMIYEGHIDAGGYQLVFGKL